MKKNKITQFQYFTTFFFLLNAFIPMIGFHTLTIISHQDALFSILLGCAMMLLFSLLMRNILNYLPEKNLFEKIKCLYPKSYLLFFFLMVLCFFSVLFLITQEFSSFVRFYLLPEVHEFWILLPLFLLLFYFLNKSSESLFHTTEICFYLYFLFFIISLFGILPQCNFLKIKPLFSSSPMDILKGSTIFFCSLPLPFLILLYFPKTRLHQRKKSTKTWMHTILYNGIFIFITLFLILSSLGIYLTNLYKNPLMVTYQKISFLNILERVESTLSFSYILLYFFPMVFLIYLLKKIIFLIAPKKGKKENLILPLILLIILFGNQFISFRQNFYILINCFLFFLLLFISISIHFKKE